MYTCPIQVPRAPTKAPGKKKLGTYKTTAKNFICWLLNSRVFGQRGMNIRTIMEINIEQRPQNRFPRASSTDLTSFVTRARIRDVGVTSSHLKKKEWICYRQGKMGDKPQRSTENRVDEVCMYHLWCSQLSKYKVDVRDTKSSGGGSDNCDWIFLEGKTLWTG
jgi:hypothetical protein